MVFDYKVKYNGIHYPAGVDVPMEKTEEPKKVVEVKEEKPVENKTLEKAKEVFAEKASETEKKGRGRKPKA